MGIYWDFPGGWWGVLAYIYGVYVLFYLLRKKKNKFEALTQIRFGLITLLLGFLLEFVGVSLGVWSYIPRNWPAILWFGYFSLGLAGYQVSKKLGETRK